MLSILITCVGVAELLAFYANVRRRLVMPLHPTLPPPPPRLQQHQHDMGCVSQNYLKELNRERNRLLNEIRRLEGAQRRNSISPDATHFKTLPDSQTHTHNVSLQAGSSSHTPQNATDISHTSYGNVAEDYLSEDSPPVYIPEKRISHVFPSYSDGGNKPVINLNRPKEEAPQIVLNDSAYESSQGSEYYDHAEHRERESSPFPTYERMAPRGSICSELIVNPTVSVDEVDEEGYRSHSHSFSNKGENSNKNDEFLKSQFDSKDYWKHKSKSRSRTPEILRENLLEFEKKSRSRSPSPLVQQHESQQQKVTTTSSGGSSSEYATPSGELVDSRFWTRSQSPFQKILDIYKATSSKSDVQEAYSGATLTEVPPDDEVGVERDVLEIVDGKLTPHEQHKRMFKNKKQRKNKKLSNDKDLELEQTRLERQSDYGSYSSSSSVIGVEENAVDASEFRAGELEEVQDAGSSSSKQGEPFWVKKNLTTP